MCLLHRFDSPPCCGFGNPRSGADARIGMLSILQVFSMERGTPIPQKRERGGAWRNLQICSNLRVGPFIGLRRAGGMF
jgi:hypothetical protein